MVDEHLLPLVGGMSFALALPFGAAALWKVRHPVRFVAVVREYRVLPDELGYFAAGSVIAAELAVAVLLVSGTAVAVASAWAALLCLGFLGAVLINLRRRRDVRCGCSSNGWATWRCHECHGNTSSCGSDCLNVICSQAKLAGDSPEPGLVGA